MDFERAFIDPSLAQRIKIVGLDVDGTLTDGGVYLGSSDISMFRDTLSTATHAPFELKRYDIQDGLGIWLLRQMGIKVVIVTGRVSHSVVSRGAELGVDAVLQDKDAMKLGLWRQALHDFNFTNDDAAFIGDDLPDLPILREVAFPVAVGNSCEEVLEMAELRLTRNGGFGAVREFCELLLKARGEWDDAVEQYVESRSVTNVEEPMRLSESE